MGVALFASTIAIALAPVAWRAFNEYRASRISPIVASPAQAEEIFGVVLSALEPLGEPPPPPEPGETPRPIEQKPIVFLNETVTFCEGQASGSSSCEPHANETILYPGIDSQIPLGFRKELVAANRTPTPIECRESSRTRCAKPETVFAILSKGGSWHDFYARFPQTAGFVQTSNVVLSQDGTAALAYITYGCGSMCGAGILVLLKRTKSSWVVIKRVRAFDV